MKEPLLINYILIPYPKGLIALAAGESGLSALSFGTGKSELILRLKGLCRRPEIILKKGESVRARSSGDKSSSPGPAFSSADEILGRAADELRAFFEGKPLGRSIPLDPPFGTPFQRAVWERARKIPYGETMSYGALAESMGSRALARAVGGALGANPIPLFVPCHRVLAADGSLGGFACGVELKQWLLELESRYGSSTRQTCT